MLIPPTPTTKIETPHKIKSTTTPSQTIPQKTLLFLAFFAAYIAVVVGAFLTAKVTVVIFKIFF